MIGVTVANRNLDGQEFYQWTSVNASQNVVSLSQSDLYFLDNNAIEMGAQETPPRDLGSLTAPSIPNVMDIEPGSSQRTTIVAARDESTQYDPERLQSVAGGLPVDSSPQYPINSNDEPEIDLSSSLMMADSQSHRQVDAQSRELFWDQFSNISNGDKKGRTEGYDSLPAILNNGFWFGGVDVMYLEPIFQTNNVITTSGNGASTSSQADYNFDAAWRGYFGFETNAGPAVKASFFRYNEFSGPVFFVADGTTSGESIVQTGNPANVFRLAATNAGDRIDTRQQIKLNSIDLLFYKDHKNAVSRVRGNVGLRFLSLQQFLFADLFESAGPITSLRSVNDFQAMGPKLGIEYFRPIGHTDLELQSGLFGSLMFGRRDHVVTDVGNLQFRQIGKLEPLSVFEMYLGMQWNVKIARCQTGFIRTAIESQYWTGGDSPSETGTDFGFYGLTAGFGVKR